MKKIINVFLDTSIFVSENFLEGHRLRSIFKMGQNGDIDIYLSRITLKEIHNQYRKRAEEAIIAHSRLINGKTDDLRVLRNNKMAATLLNKFPKLEVVCAEFKEQLEENLENAKVTILDYPEMNIGEVFEKYFSSLPPFHRADKKAEFPDAFAQAHIEQWCSANKTNALLLTEDKDFVTEPPSFLSVDHNYRKFVEDHLLLFQTERVLLAKELFAAYLPSAENEVCKWLTEQLDDDRIYIDIANWMDVHDISIISTEITETGFDVVAIDGDFVTFEAVSIAQYSVVIEIDDEETGIWDSEDHEMLFRESKQLKIDKTVSIPFGIQFAVIDKDDFDEEGEIMEINNGKDLEIPADYYH